MDSKSCISAFISCFSKSEFASDRKLDSPGSVQDLFKQLFGDGDVNPQRTEKITNYLHLGELIRHKIDGSEKAEEICTLMFEDDVVTPARAMSMCNAIQLTDLLLSTNLLGTLDEKIRTASNKFHEDALFKEPGAPDPDPCPICSLPLPFDEKKVVHRVCCGKNLCMGCIYGIIKGTEGRHANCPFCRHPPYQSNEEYMVLLLKGVREGRTSAIHNLGCHYYDGTFDLDQDIEKAIKLWTESGLNVSYYNIGTYYCTIGQNWKRSQYYYEKAAIGGNIKARYALGILEEGLDDRRSMRHLIIASQFGHSDAMTKVVEGYRTGRVTKTNLEKALRNHQQATDAMRSTSREAGELRYRALGVSNGVRNAVDELSDLVALLEKSGIRNDNRNVVDKLSDLVARNQE